MALLYQSGKTFKRHAKVPNASYWQDFLPDDSYYIWDTDSVLFGGEGQVRPAFFIFFTLRRPNFPFLVLD